MKIRTYQHPKLRDRIKGIFCEEESKRWFVVLQIMADGDEMLSVVKELDGQLDPTALLEQPIGYSDERLIDAIARWDIMMTDPVIQAAVIVQELKNPVVGIDDPDELDSLEDDTMGA